MHANISRDPCDPKRSSVEEECEVCLDGSCIVSIVRICAICVT
jgi:hypothetical protein